MTKDFDLSKYYEETVLNIMNEMPRTKIIEPEGYGSFGEMYPNISTHKRTIFLDLDDTLVYVSPFKQNKDFDQGY